MKIMEIVQDSLTYPFNNLQSLLIYIVLSIVACIVLVITGVGVGMGVGADQVAVAGILGIVGIIIALLILVLIEGFMLDVIKLGIERDDSGPEIDLGRQIMNGIKLIIVGIVYFIIPTILIVILTSINQYLGIIGYIVLIVFAFAFIMAQCRLAKTGELGEALNIMGAINDLKEVGIIKLIAVMIIIAIVAFILILIAGLLGNVSDILAAILNGIFSAFIAFASSRATGLVYSDM